MTKIDFYILADNSINQRHHFACRLAEKAYKLGHQIYFHSDDNAQANALDQLLWSWRTSSFIPHQVEDFTNDTSTDETNSMVQDSRVQIGFNETLSSATKHCGLMINLAQKVPEFFSRFERVSETVVNEPNITDCIRAHFRFYRDRGYPLQTHNLKK